MRASGGNTIRLKTSIRSKYINCLCASTAALEGKTLFAQAPESR